MIVPKERVDNFVLGADPADPGEDGEGGEEVAGEEVPEEGAQKDDEEEAFAGHVPLFGPAVRRMERVEERGIDKGRGPNHRARPDEEAAADSREGEAEHLRGDDEQELVRCTPLLEVENALGGNDVGRVCATCDDVGHDGDQTVLLDVERARVERETVLLRPWAAVEGHGGESDCVFPGWEYSFTGSAGWEGKQLGDHSRYGYTGVSHGKKLIKRGD